MINQWGIFRGFRKSKDRLNKWNEPKCEDCGTDLLPWIDWISHGSLGYCKNCKMFYAVKYHTQLSQNTHVREEISELVEHKLHRVQFEESIIGPEEIWKYYKQIPVDVDTLQNMVSIKQKLSSLESAESKLVEHLLWRIIFNSECFDKSMFVEYLMFVLEYPYFFEIFDDYEIWLGYEIDLVTYLETSNKIDIIDSIFEVWTLHNSNYTISQFKQRIGIFVAFDYNNNDYGDEFISFLSKIKTRLF